ncbi:MAG: YjbQ family protein [Thermoproteota archaeon]|nr:MAG: YjbQ family protein [Candidatus Korarchaeota archaeon]RLG51423.1 MAG: YjbQ family protein [Candidatus Korarchaeota archaeon]
MKVYTAEIELQTRGEVDIIDITQRVQDVVSESGVRNGIAVVFAVGSTCAVTTMEYEPGLKKDIPAALERLFPKGIEYEHHKTWGDYNGHSHVRASFLKADYTIPVVDSKLPLGTWQQLVFIELDTRPRRRRVIVQVMGE